MNAISFPLPAGYRTGRFDVANQLLTDAPSPGRLLDLLLLADQLDNEQTSHLPPPAGDWGDLRERTGRALLQRLSGAGDITTQNWMDAEKLWQPKMFRHAIKSIPGMPDGDLLTLFIQAAETAYLHETEPMQARWDKVAAECRAEILRRIGERKLPADAIVNSDVEDGRDDAGEDDYVSLREILRLAETSFKPDMPDEKLLDLYLVVDAHGGPDEEVFDEILEGVSDLLFRRMREGTPGIDPDKHVPGFDPHEDERALQALMGGDLSHRDLVTLYLVSFDNAGQLDIGARWIAINDLCRAQILRRMPPGSHAQPYRADAIWRLQEEDRTPFDDRGGADDPEA